MADVAATLAGWSSTTASNSPSGTTSIGTGLDDNLREIQGVIVRGLSHKGADIASATTTDIGAVEGLAHDITGTTTITGLGTVRAGILKVLKFEGALTFTHNATSLILPGGANITTADGDIAVMISEGSGNWRCVFYTRASGAPIAGFRKNALINGDFQIWPEGTSFAAIAAGTYFAEMWNYQKSGAMVHTVSQYSDVPTIAEAGRKIPFSVLVDCTTADAAIAAGDYCVLRTYVEGSNFVNIAGVGLCHQFWCKHTKTGIYCVSYSNSGQDRTFVREYTQDASDTWEFKSVLVDASPSAGTWDYTTGVGFIVNFVLASGSTFNGTADAWQSAALLATSNQVNACDNVANNFILAGVQLEKGSVATEFERLPIQQLSALCQRYWEKSYDTETLPGATDRRGAYSGTYGPGIVGVLGPRYTPKRIIPTMTGYSPLSGASGKLYDTTAADVNITFANIGKNGVETVQGAGATAGFLFHWTANARF